MSETYFPMHFMVAGKRTRDGGTHPGLYLRWLVQPYLGVPGISPYYPQDIDPRHWAGCGFRLFFTTRIDDSQITRTIPLGSLLPQKPAFGVTDVCDRDLQIRPGWKACYADAGGMLRVRLDLTVQYQQSIPYLRFNYSQFANQRIELKYTLRDGQTGALTDKTVALHYPDLSEDLARQKPAGEFVRPYADLSYAINVESAGDSIQSLEFAATGCLVMGDFEIAGPAAADYYAWSPPRGIGPWTEIPAGQYLLKTLNASLILPAESDKILDALQEFYKGYYGSQPAGHDPQRIVFVHPPLPQFQLDEPPLREYLSDQYDLLCRGRMDAGLPAGASSGCTVRPQEAAWLAANDPAVAYLFGLFRILESEQAVKQKSMFKVQGQWPDGKRFCIYRLYDPALELTPPRIGPLSAQSGRKERTLRDYLTFRTHHPLNCVELAWNAIPSQATAGKFWIDPVAYLVMRGRPGNAPLTCLSSFFLLRKADKNFLDWYEHYPKTDIPKPLDGKYSYWLAGFDPFGQLSDWQNKDAQVAVAPLPPGEIHLPEIKLLDPAGKIADLPIEVENTASGYLTKAGYKSLRLSFSFFWPLESSYIWDRNRATGAVSLDSFRLLYLPETALSAPVRLKIQSNGPDGLKVLLEDTYPQVPGHTWKNSALFGLLLRLGVADHAGVIDSGAARAALEDGRLELGREFRIATADLAAAPAAIILTLLPTRDEKPEQLTALNGIPLVDLNERTDEEITGRLSWNHEASYAGMRLGWKSMGLAGEKTVPLQPLDLHSPLNIQNKSPNTPPASLADLPAPTGFIGYQPPQAEGRFEFTITLAQGHPVFDLERFMITPLDPASGLEPGEFPANALPQDSLERPPAAARVLFSSERLLSFYLVRLLSGAAPGTAIFRGEPLLYTSRPALGAPVQETLLFPDPFHSHWRIVPPNTVEREIPLSDFLGDGAQPPVKPFTSSHTLSTSMTIGIDAVAGADPEVRDSLQNARAVQKIVFQEVLPPPVFKVPDQPQPAFGIAAGRPGYDGVSLISVRKIFEGYDLDTLLSANHKYLLYRLPADRVFMSGPASTSVSPADSLPVRYALYPPTDSYRRDLQSLQAALDSFKPVGPQPSEDYLASADLQALFSEYAEKVESQPLDKSAFPRLPVNLPGESHTVFLFALKAYDDTSGKESGQFTCLSKPVYVEDIATPPAPLALSVRVTRLGNDLTVKADLPRKLSEIDGYGYIAPSELPAQSALLGPSLPYLAADYRVYLTNDTELVGKAGESDFAPVAAPGATYGGGAGQATLRQFALKLLPQALALQPNDDHVQLEGTIKFSSAYDLENMPGEVCICLRAINYLGEMSPLRFKTVRIQA